MGENNRSPDELLEAVARELQSERGRLRIFLGMCPGVGKTYAMLKAAKEQLNRGVRASIGIVETHGRKETEELLAGLHMFPRKTMEYKGAVLAEMDLDAILKERPSLVLVDELAHSNAPGSRHKKRFQDVEELLRAGIDVYTTINIQHIESRNDQVAQITGVQVRETVPDSFLENADQVEVVDLAPRELLRRLREGKVYLGDRAANAIQNFFKEEHLTALRELALRFTAEKVDQDLSDQMTIKGIAGPWNANERLLVAVSHSPYSGRLIRSTRRMAYNLEAPWVALYVNTGANLEKDDAETLQKNLSLARELGAEVCTIVDTDVARAIQKVCQNKNVTQIVMGRPDRRFFKDLISRGTLLDQLVRTTSKIDVHVIRAERKPKYRGFYMSWPNVTTGFFAYYNTTWFLLGVSFFCYGLLPFLGYRPLGSIFLLSILVVSSLASRGPILFAATVSALVWDFFFIPPQFTFSIRLTEDIFMVISFFVTALVGGLLTSRIRRQESILQSREEISRLLYELSQELASAKNVRQIESVLASTIDKQFGGNCSVYFSDKDGKINWSSGFGQKLSEKELAVANWAFENNKSAGWSTQTLSAASCLCMPMRGNSGVVGILTFLPSKNQKEFTIEKENFLNTVLTQASIAFERLQFSEVAQSARLYEASEKLHQTLLNSVSHELRTPITAIIGSATALKDAPTLANAAAREMLTSDLVSSARRLDRVVENLLDVSRLEKGTLQLRREWFELSDLLVEVKLNLKEELLGRNLSLAHDDAVLLEGDFKLLSHALGQIVHNAVKYSNPNSEIQIEFRHDNNWARILVCDEGSGIPEGQEKKIFEKFFRLPGTAAGGLGLGLTIANNILELHGGTIRARNRSDRHGAIFELSLPLKVAPHGLQEALR